MIGSRPAAIAFLGLGLIGGSIVKALAAYGDRASRDPKPRIVAWSPDGVGPSQAFHSGVIDAIASDPAEAVEGADLVVIAAPPLATIELIGRLGADLRTVLAARSVVTDVASTKGEIMTAAASAKLRFVGGHPMAGREMAGFEASNADLFRDRPWVIVSGSGADPGLVEPVRWLAGACGARPVALDAATHDLMVAAISHLPLLASVALVEAVAGTASGQWSLARWLAGSGWNGMTRLARGDARMGAGIAATNGPAIVAELRAYRAAIDSWIVALDTEMPDAIALENRLAAVKALLDPDPGGR